LNNSVTIVVPYNKADIPAGQTESHLVLGVWNDSTQTYDTLPTTVDTTNSTLTAVVSHFSDFAPLFSDTPAPDVTDTSNIAASYAGSAGYTGYTSSGPSGSSATPPKTPPIASSSTSPAARQVINISPYNRVLSVGSNGADVVALQAFLEKKGFLVMPKNTPKGLFGAVTKNALIKYQKSVGLQPLGQFGPATKTNVEKDSISTSTTVTITVNSTDYVFSKNLSFGSSGNDVSTLQAFLVKKGLLVIPKGMAYGYYGNLTVNAVKAYQKSVGVDAVGSVGSSTLIKLNKDIQTAR
jgi:peptidoglycan hydrolase-like protein with peptidoglycan-binding domain